MRRVMIILALTAMLTTIVGTAALAGSPHFVGDATITRDGNSLTVSGKLAGLGNEQQVDIQVTALAECINPGSNKPKAANKQSLSAEGQFPVQNGKANYSLTLTATFQPSCSPPMTVVFSNVVVTDVTHGISQSYPGPF